MGKLDKSTPSWKSREEFIITEDSPSFMAERESFSIFFSLFSSFFNHPHGVLACVSEGGNDDDDGCLHLLRMHCFFGLLGNEIAHNGRMGCS